ncbi:MAG: universal stress protein, partial [Chitinophagaceae bacterium]|nr:universal stress protein [Chitinophagaceae bacterium]
MQTILVPVDFSTTAYNAAVYALELGKQLQVQKVILYHSYELPVVSDGGLAVPLLVGVDDIQKTSSEALENLLNNLKEKVEYVPFEIETYHTYNSTVNGIKEAVQEKQANLIVMGITGGNAIEQALIGSNTIDVSKEVTIPLIIVPANATFKPIRNTVLA